MGMYIQAQMYTMYLSVVYKKDYLILISWTFLSDIEYNIV